MTVDADDVPTGARCGPPPSLRSRSFVFTSTAASAADAVLLEALPRGRAPQRAATIVSNSVRGGAGWAAVSAVLALAGGRYRVAGAEGLAAWAAAEAAAAGLKRVVSRRRPSRPRGAARTRSSSMPSSHTASAVAYAVAAGTRVPALAAPLAVGAGAVAWSRLVSRRHYPTDVLAGGVLGLLVGRATVSATRRRR